ncbi:MAG: hypothetical protein U0797_25040 [Gemmataceae bacterium]
MLIGQRKPTAGRVLVAGLDVVRDWYKAASLFGRVPRPGEPLRGVHRLGQPEAVRRPLRRREKRVADCSAMVERSEAAGLPVRGYSLGMPQAAAGLVPCSYRPRLLYLDESTANLDIHSCDVVHRILRGLVAGGTTVLLTTHNMKEVEKVCDRVAIPVPGSARCPRLAPGLRCARATPSARSMSSRVRRPVLSLDLDDPAQKATAWASIAAGVASLQTREFDFHEAFLKLTGTAFE